MRSLSPATELRPTGTPAVSQHGSMLATGFENSLLGMALVSPDGRFLQANGALCRLLGRGEEELTTLTFTDVTHRDDVDLSYGNLARALSGAVTGFKLQKRYLHADGRVVWAVLTTSLLRDSEGAPLCFFSQVLDLSDPDPDVGSAPQHLLGHPGASRSLGRMRVRDGQHDGRLVEVVATNLLHHRRGGIRIGVRLLQWPEAGGTGSGTGPEPAGRLLAVEADERS